MNPSTIAISLNFEHSYAEQLPEFFASVWPAPVREPGMLQFNHLLAGELGLDRTDLTTDVLLRIFSGNELPVDARPIAQAYAGHQFGNFVPQLGDGRALLLGEVIDRQGKRRDIALKGSGRTPFSRGGDGKAAVGPVLREYLIGEAMHALGIPTTRALAAVATGEPVMRDRPLPRSSPHPHRRQPCACWHVSVLCRPRSKSNLIQKLADYIIERHYPEVTEDDRAISLTVAMVSSNVRQPWLHKWMQVGFIHGVMNTDNMAIAGETIDFGPCAFMESYDPQTVFSSIDRHGRYAYANQPTIALWNLARFAETLLSLLGEEDSERAVAEAMAVLETFMPTFEQHWYQGARTKLGLANPDNPDSVSDSERKLVDDWLELLTKSEVDFTLAWRRLAEAAEGNASQLRSLFTEQTEVDAWLERWRGLQGGVQSSQLASAIRAANPLYIPRNHLVEEALAAASGGDLTPFESLLKAVQSPFDENPQCARYAVPAPAEFTANYQTFCGT